MEMNDYYEHPKTSGNRIHRFLSGFGTLIMIILLGWGEIYGIYHAFSKHNDGILAIFIPPLAWYRSIEGVFWHNDFAGVDWEKQLSLDSRTIVGLIELSGTDDVNAITQKHNVILEFSKEISKYPDEKKFYLMSVFITYSDFTRLALYDVFDQLESMCRGEKKDFYISEGTNKKIDEMRKYPGVDDVIPNSIEEFKFFMETVAEKLKNVKLDQFKEYRLLYERSVIADIELLKTDLFTQEDWDEYYKNQTPGDFK